ncbi:MAG: hypothetical protein US49_C0002G0017 [candidate division TM6 bacterium GW2011_GWF2_37_49]|nr:MAG: hypothetical protein US49_C0002G0017 [candidate division TM6 bacterium GW2011_GWF2_37_49]
MNCFGVFKNYALILSFLSLIFSCLCAALSVDTSLRLSAEEVAYIQKRDTFTQDKILNIVQDLFPSGFDKNINKLPRIAFCFSGGGSRALITSLGFMQGMQECGLVDCASYCALLSGSSWFYTTLMLKNMDLDNYREFIKSRMAQPFNKSVYGFWSELSSVSKQRGYSSISDGYGKSVYTYLLGDTVSENASFDDIRKAVVSGAYNLPFPLFTAIVKSGYPYKWLEFNPFLTGSDELGGYVKTANWGSCFEKGVCTKELPELSLASFMGIWGSAYCINRSDFERCGGAECLKSQPFYYYLEQTLGRIISTDNLLYSAMNQIESRSMFENHMFDMGLTSSEYKRVVVADAGLDFNLPTPPLLKKERGIDLIFICDASAYTEQNDEHEQFKALTEHARRNGIAIPDLENPIKLTDDIFVFEDKDPCIPTIVYFKLWTSFGTLKFDYSNDEFDAVCDNAKNMVTNFQYGINLTIKKKTMLLNQRRGWFKNLLSYLSI